MNDFRKLIPKGVLSSRKRLRELSKAIDVRQPEDTPQPEWVKHPVTKASWRKTMLAIHRAVTSL